MEPGSASGRFGPSRRTILVSRLDAIRQEHLETLGVLIEWS